MREVCLVSAYAPDHDRQDLLRDLVRSLHGNKDVLLVSHSIVPRDIQERVKYLFYDEENEVIFNKHSSWYYYQLEGAQIWTRDHFWYKTTLLPVTKLFFNGLTIAKTLGYDVAHYVEYDARIPSTDFLTDNANKVIEESADGLVYWIHGHPIGGLQTYNLSSYTFERLKWDRDYMLDRWNEIASHRDSLGAPVENIVYDIMNFRDGLIRVPCSGNGCEIEEVDVTFNSIHLKPSKSSLIHCIVVVKDDGKVTAFSKNMSRDHVKVCYLTSNRILTEHSLPNGIWTIEDIGSINDISNVSILIDGVVSYTIDLSTPEKIRSHKDRNYII